MALTNSFGPSAFWLCCPSHLTRHADNQSLKTFIPNLAFISAGVGNQQTWLRAATEPVLTISKNRQPFY